MTKTPRGPRTPDSPIRVVLADDHPIVREGLKAMLERTCVRALVTGEASDGNELLALAAKTSADVYVVDIAMPRLNGMEAMVRLLRMDKKAKVIILSMHGDRFTIEKAFRAGCRGYLVKESAAKDIVPAVAAVQKGRFYLSPSVFCVELSDLTDSGTGPKGRADDLSSREREIVQLIAEGLGSAQISRRMGITPNTVHVHRRNIARKLDIHKSADIVRYAIKKGIVRP